MLLGMTLALFAYLLAATTLYASLLLVGGLVIYQTYGLIRYVERTNRQLTRFLQSIAYADLSQTFTRSGLGRSFDELHAAFTEVTDAFRKVRAEREEQYRYLQTVVQHVGVGVMAYRQNGDVELLNNAARRLLRMGASPPSIKNIAVLEPFHKPLVDALRQLKPGERALIRVGGQEEYLQLALYATGFKMQDRQLTLVTIQNIQSELEEKEMEAWQNLIRVLTHEIMNSVTPISSLAGTANELLMENGHLREDMGEETATDIQSALKTIQSRSEGLLHFVETYRNLTRIPQPEFRIVRVSELFDRVQRLMQQQIEARHVRLYIHVEPESLKVAADPELIEQVLINLVTNAIEAMRNQPDACLRLSARINEQGRVIIQVTDNGPGILEDVQEKIFIPFFTTKQNGSGIGLSLSRQIMRLHRGAIGVRSTPHEETTFTLRF